ncbi:MAG: hypothetical protein HON94_06210 [Methylococcales bacterium]|jgi:hypothetical protein|nr:hypothetical protein [Methylococcales bacterium]MBT7410214.1 hypothetical protein [Methylococcales bacterium]
METKLSFKLIKPNADLLDKRLKSLFLRKEKFLAHLLDTEINNLKIDIGEKQQSEKARRYIYKALHNIKINNEKVDLVPISIFVNKETAQKLKKIEDKNRVLRNSFFNRLILFLLSTHRTLKRFDIAETMTNKNIHDDWHEDFLQFTGGLDGLENIIRDPLENIRVAFKGESQQDNGLYNTRLPPAYIGFECYLDDEYVPNTKEYQKRIKEENEFADSL